MTRLLFLALFAAGLGGCGILYTNIHGPYAYRSASPSEVKAAPFDPTTSGLACNYSLLYLVAWGDGGYAAATRKALDGKPEAILYDVKSDIKVTAVLLGLYTRTCTKVTGRVGHS
jgi:hypothetical protein